MPRRLKVDMHIHTYYSKDSDLAPEVIIKYAKLKGIDCIAIVDHNEIAGAFEVERISKDIIVFIGEEIKTESGEVIGINIDKKIKGGMSLRKTCNLIKKNGGFVIIPHPFDMLRSGIGKNIYEIMDYVDAIEVFNARTLFNHFNKRARKLAVEEAIPMLASSDSHFFYEIGNAYTIVESDSEKENILEAIRKGHAVLFGKGSGIRPHISTFLVKLRKQLRQL
ncbi:MAG TPA: PHP domain-containing protein [Candidatus Aenigmarchaeota archaeon]|nr:PHP domain-containing protein [Candidatus Aenigmarchaeota archaeon]